jgi:hypothetical protein
VSPRRLQSRRRQQLTVHFGKYVVWTDKQGQSGLGLDAQRQAS